MSKIKFPFRKATDERIARRLEAIKAQPSSELVNALEKMLREEREARMMREVGLISFGRYAHR